jgi:uncharacterized protein
MYKRNISLQIKEALADTPVVLLAGARQTGKTTLIRREDLGILVSNYVTLDDLDSVNAALSDPTGFLSGLAARGEPVILDEVQRAPLLFQAIKGMVDRDRRPGRFLLTGSANVLMLPKVSESLAGRIEILTLYPLSQSEIEGISGSFVDLLFSGEVLLKALPATMSISRENILQRLTVGGYPEPLTRTEARRPNWFDAYLTTILQRDVRDLANIEGLTQLPRLLALLAARTASLLNLADIGRSINIPYSTLQRYMTLLEAAYLIRTVPAWSGNITNRLIKSPRVILNDTGVAAHLLGFSAERLMNDMMQGGGLLENFAVMELIKDGSWSRTRPTFSHWHTANREEVDLVLERRDGKLVGVEIKASASVGSNDFKGLRALQAQVGEQFLQGIVLYTGERVVPFGENLTAVPLSALWS